MKPHKLLPSTAAKLFLVLVVLVAAVDGQAALTSRVSAFFINNLHPALAPLLGSASSSLPSPHNSSTTAQHGVAEQDWPSPKGLMMGIGSVFVFQALGVLYYYCRMVACGGPPPSIQVRPPPKSDFWQDLIIHATRLEAFVMLVSYLSITWMFKIMPASYYDLEAPISWLKVFLQLAWVDFWTFVIHRIEHQVRILYVNSHKAHHQFVVPKMLNAFTGSLLDTTLLILLPLIITTRCVPGAHCFDYIAFGTLYSFDFLIIHCEFRNPWDPLFEALGIGTASHHNVHHAILNKNFGHLFMWWDMLCGTYVDPRDVAAMRQKRSRD